MTERKPYFNPAKVPEPTKEFVAWVDLMGCSNLMAQLKVVSIAIFKLHVAALDTLKVLDIRNLILYPVMDGFYATTTSQKDMMRFLTDVFYRVSIVFLEDSDKPQLQFLIKGAVSFGDIYHGRMLKVEAAKRLDENQQYRDSILIGQPVVDAHQSESSAPPFGIALHESAREGFDLTEREVWWNWFNEEFNAKNFYSELNKYFNWNLDQKENGGYKIERIIVHDALSKRYFI
jgi:hypothetical protein